MAFVGLLPVFIDNVDVDENFNFPDTYGTPNVFNEKEPTGVGELEEQCVGSGVNLERKERPTHSTATSPQVWETGVWTLV